MIMFIFLVVRMLLKSGPDYILPLEDATIIMVIFHVVRMLLSLWQIATSPWRMQQ